MKFILENLIGIVSITILTLNTIILSCLLIPLGLIKFFLPITNIKVLFTKFIINIGELWIFTNKIWVKDLTDSDGMLFIWKNEDKRCMWMKNTFIPLDLGFFRDDMTLIEVKDLSPKSLKSVCPSEPAKYAIELPRGWFSSNNISNNSKLGFN